jgi:hypothetical protein
VSSSHARRSGEDGSRRVAAAALTVALLGCLPTVQLGRDDDGSSGPSTGAQETGVGGLDMASTAPAGPDSSTTSQAGGAPVDTGMGTGVDPGTGMEPDPGGNTDATSSDTAATWCDSQETDNACLQCARQQCCAELDLCADQEPCSCFIDCLGVEMVPDADACLRQCGGSSGIAAVQACLAMACPGVCGPA